MEMGDVSSILNGKSGVKCGNKAMLTADMYNNAVVVAMSLMELPVSDD